jgi:C4-dicarboxylate transporter DctQ subunit
MKFISRLCDGLEKIITNLSALLVIIITSLIGIEVVGRYFFNKSYGFLEDFSRWMMVWISFLSAGVLLRKDQHVRIDVLEIVFRPLVKNIMKLLSLIACLITGIWFSWAGTLTCIRAYRSLEMDISVLDVPLYIIRLALPIGMCCLVIFSIELLVINFKALIFRE